MGNLGILDLMGLGRDDLLFAQARLELDSFPFQRINNEWRAESPCPSGGELLKIHLANWKWQPGWHWSLVLCRYVMKVVSLSTKTLELIQCTCNQDDEENCNEVPWLGKCGADLEALAKKTECDSSWLDGKKKSREEANQQLLFVPISLGQDCCSFDSWTRPATPEIWVLIPAAPLARPWWQQLGLVKLLQTMHLHCNRNTYKATTLVSTTHKAVNYSTLSQLSIECNNTLDCN